MKEMRRLFLFVVLIAGLAFVPQLTEAAEAPAKPILSVDGSGAATATPDEATVAIGVTTHAGDAAKAQNDNAWTSGQIQKAMSALGIADKDMQTRNYSFRPTYREDANHQNEINGYTVDNTIIVRVHDVQKTGKVIDAALRSGANEISSLDFSASNTEGVRREALEKAIADAKDKANIIAKGLGKRIVGIQNVSENTSSIGPRHFNGGYMVMASMAKAADTAIQPGSLSLSATVHIDFILSE